jgi:gamma-glutamylputrescine oxidase
MLPLTSDRLFEQSYYKATANPTPKQRQLWNNHNADLVVIGAGYTGLATALRAAENGMKVIVLEQYFPGFGASGRNGGQLIPGLRWDARTLLAKLGDERGKAIFNLSLLAQKRVLGRINSHDISCDLKSGHATMAWNEEHYRDLGEEAECLARDMGYSDIELVSPESGRAVVDSDLYHGGMIDRRGGHFHPLNYAIGLAQAATAAGVKIYSGKNVVGVVEHKEHVQACVEGGNVFAKSAMLAVDTRMSSLNRRLGGYAMPILNYNIATEPLGEERARALIPCDVAVADTRFVLNYFRLSADHRLIFGGGEKYLPTAPKSIDDFVRKHMSQVFPQLANVKIDYRWGGPVGVSLNRLPHVGRSDGGRLWFAHGFSGHGALMTTLAGEAVADAIAGQSDTYQFFASLPSRPFPGGTLLRWPLHVAGMLYYALRDRL